MRACVARVMCDSRNGDRGWGERTCARVGEGSFWGGGRKGELSRGKRGTGFRVVANQ